MIRHEVMTLIRSLRSSPFARNVLVLMSGTALAQGITVAVSPLLTRLYRPEEYGVFGLFTAIVGTFAVVACLRYRFAIMLPKEEREAAALFWLAGAVVVAMSGLLLVVVALAHHWVATTMKSEALAWLLWWAPLPFLAIGLGQVLELWATRRHQFHRLSVSRVFRNAGTAVTQAGTGLAGWGPLGLVLGFLVGNGLPAVLLGGLAWRDDRRDLASGWSWSALRRGAREHGDFPKYNAPAAVVNVLSQSAVPFLLGAFFGPGTVGQYWLCDRLLAYPTELVSRSVRQIFFQSASEIYRAQGDLYGALKKATLGLAVIGVLPMVLLVAFGPRLFAFAFGRQWLEAGQLARWLALGWFVVFITPPSVELINVLNLQRYQLPFEAVVMVFRVAAILVGGFARSPLLAVALYSIFGLILYSLLMYWMAARVRGAPLTAGPQPHDTAGA